MPGGNRRMRSDGMVPVRFSTTAGNRGHASGDSVA